MNQQPSAPPPAYAGYGDPSKNNQQQNFGFPSAGMTQAAAGASYQNYGSNQGQMQYGFQQQSQYPPQNQNQWTMVILI